MKYRALHHVHLTLKNVSWMRCWCSFHRQLFKRNCARPTNVFGLRKYQIYFVMSNFELISKTCTVMITCTMMTHVVTYYSWTYSHYHLITFLHVSTIFGVSCVHMHTAYGKNLSIYLSMRVFTCTRVRHILIAPCSDFCRSVYQAG